MAATQGMLNTKSGHLDPSIERDIASRTRGLGRVAASLDETTKAQIFRQWRRGVSIDVSPRNLA